MEGFVALVETVATRYYSTPYVGCQNCKWCLPPNVWAPISRKLVVRFLRNFAHFYGSTMSITCSIQNNSHLPRKFPGSILVFFWFWGWPLNWPPNIDCYGGFVEVVETVATRYYSTHYVMVKKFEPPYLENWKSEFPVILQFFRGRQYL